MPQPPLHIAHLLLTSRFAGTERHVVELANAQAEAGHRVTVFLRAAGAENRADAIAHRLSGKVEVVVVGNLFAWWRARAKLRRLAPAIAHAHLSGGCRALRGWRTATTRRVATLHIDYKPRQHGDMDGLIAIAPWQLNAMPDAMRARTVQVDNWTLPHVVATKTRSALRSAHGLGSADFVFGALGRVEPGKGLDVLVDAWRRARLPADARLIIVGQGSAWNALRASAPGDVLMPGFAGAARDWLATFDVFVSSARKEPFGLVLLEAMDAGLPIIASASEGATHLRGFIASPLLPIGDPDALATALRATYGARPARRVYSMERFRIEDKLALIDAFYRLPPLASVAR